LLYKQDKIKYALHLDNNKDHFKVIYLTAKPSVGEYLQLDPYDNKETYLIENVIHSYIDYTKAQIVHLFVTNKF